MKVLKFDFGTLLIGQNAKENWNIIDDSEDEDIWFHLDNVPSCHMVAQTIRNLTDSEIQMIANMFCEYSKSNSRNVIFSEIKNVKKNKSKIGSVFVENKKLITL